jgi:O-antigen ligase
MKLNLFTNITRDRIAASVSFVIPILLGIFIFVNPFPHITAIKEITFYLSLGLFLMLILLRPTEYSLQSPLTLPFLLFILWSLAGLFFALNKQNSIHDFLMHLLKYIAYYYILINVFRTRNRFLVLTWLIIISSVIFAIGNIVYYYGIAGNSLTSRLGLSLVQIQTNSINIVTVFASILALGGFFSNSRFYPKIFLFFSLFIIILTSFLTQTRGAIMALLTGIIILFFNKKKVLIGLFSLLILILAVTPMKNRITLDAFLHNERISTNLVTWEIIKDYPIFGIGFGMQTYDDYNFLKPYHEKVPIEYRHERLVNHPHNLFFDTAVRTGLIGFVLFLYLILNAFRMGRNIMCSGHDPFFRNWDRCLMAAFVAIIIQGMFEPTLSGPPAIILYTILGMMTILWRLQHDKMDKLNSVTEKVKVEL